MGHLVDEAQVRIGAALLLLGPLVPLLFQGEEWNASTPFLYFTDHDDPQLAEAVSQGRRASFGDFGWDADEVPDPQDAASFLRSKLDWSEPGREPHRSMLDWYRQLLALRREHAALEDHQLEDVAVDYDEEARWLVLYPGSLAVVCHLNDGPGEIRLRAPASRVLMASEGDVTEGEAMVRLSGPGVTIVALDG
jgi:maltooligosyltrehalose trehalohydrolase